MTTRPEQDRAAFRKRWAGQSGDASGECLKRLLHPEAGLLSLEY